WGSVRGYPGPEQTGGVHALVGPGERRVGRDVDASVARHPKGGVGFQGPASAIPGLQPEGDRLSGRGPGEPQRGDLVDEGPCWDMIKANARGVTHERLLCWTDIRDDILHLRYAQVLYDTIHFEFHRFRRR